MQPVDIGIDWTWGPQLRADGSARFRLWAPGQERVVLVGSESSEGLPMVSGEDGWFALETRSVAVGQGYAFGLQGGQKVPDPAARMQVTDVHGPSRLIDPASYTWRSNDWKGRPWSEAVIYELHTGTFSPGGTFEGVQSKLDHLVDLGVTAIELMPVAQFSGERGWGYDGVLLYAPHVAYGGPDALKRLVDHAHERGLMVLLDVVYNHFGPDGNYLHLYAPQFFNPLRQTPWGVAIDYTRAPVRRFFIENALYWLQEYRFDGLRFDAIDQIRDSSAVHILEELAQEVRKRIPDREVHLTTEDERNVTHLHRRDEAGRPTLFTAEWNDDFHHVGHMLTTGEADGYYTDYAEYPALKLGRALAEGYVYQGEPSRYHGGAPRGYVSVDMPPTAFINFLQNHDQIGNRALGERLARLADRDALALLTAILLLSPQVPLLFMGEEWGETRPFQFFTDFNGDLADAVREGRRNEFRNWRQFSDPSLRDQIPDPNARETFQNSQLDWRLPDREGHRERLAYVKRLLAIRRRDVMPFLSSEGGPISASWNVTESLVSVTWTRAGVAISLVANLSSGRHAVPECDAMVFERGRVLFEVPAGAAELCNRGELPPWSGVFRCGDVSDPGKDRADG